MNVKDKILGGVVLGLLHVALIPCHMFLLCVMGICSIADREPEYIRWGWRFVSGFILATIELVKTGDETVFKEFLESVNDD